jgi:hypothetical protein
MSQTAKATDQNMVLEIKQAYDSNCGNAVSASFSSCG